MKRCIGDFKEQSIENYISNIKDRRWRVIIQEFFFVMFRYNVDIWYNIELYFQFSK